MNMTSKPETPLYPIAANSKELATLLGCGYKTAVTIGNEAGAKITIGKRVIWNVKTVQKYLDKIQNDQNTGVLKLVE